MDTTETLYMIHDLRELDCPELDKELATLISSVCAFPDAARAHRTAFQLFSVKVADRVNRERQERHRTPDEDELLNKGMVGDDE